MVVFYSHKDNKLTKLYNQIIQQNILPFKDFYTYSTGVTRSALNSDLCINKFRLDCRKFSFSSRSLKIWNFLPLNVRKSANISIFKKTFIKLTLVLLFTGVFKCKIAFAPRLLFFCHVF